MLTTPVKRAAGEIESKTIDSKPYIENSGTMIPVRAVSENFGTEDTYEVPKYPEMGYQRGRYTKEEFAEIDSYAKSMGVELIGCIQALGHMSQVVKWASFSDIAENDALLLPGEERTYEFIEECIKTISENISSRRIHIGLDETFGLCEGKYKTIHGESDPLEVYTERIFIF